ncbi:MAG TPA: aminotransferase class IV [Solirubrobacterales bacterium]|nr:aminotransferase class IV [Solirubrobacterales bacterium]
MPVVAANWRPDPSKGVFETLLALDGRPVEPDAHLARLESSLAVLYPGRTRPTLDVPAVDRLCGGSTTGASVEALRIVVAPGVGGELAVTTECRPSSGHLATENGGKVTSDAAALLSLGLAGGLGAHKWADRSFVEQAQAGLPDDALPLIVDEDGAVLEVSRANVFTVRGGCLLTPTLDGRILPGVTRMRVLAIAAALGLATHESALRRDDLLTADEVFLTGSVRGIEPAGSLDGSPLPGGGPIAERLAAELRRAWAGLKTAASFG